MTTLADLWDTPEQAMIRRANEKKKREQLKGQILESFLRCRYLMHLNWLDGSVLAEGPKEDILSRWDRIFNEVYSVLAPLKSEPKE